MSWCGRRATALTSCLASSVRSTRCGWRSVSARPATTSSLAASSSRRERESIIRILQQRAAAMPTPGDWVYVNNFKSPESPAAIYLRGGQGAELRDGMRDLVSFLIEQLPKAFRREDFDQERKALAREIQPPRPGTVHPARDRRAPARLRNPRHAHRPGRVHPAHRRQGARVARGSQSQDAGASRGRSANGWARSRASSPTCSRPWRCISRS